MIKLLKYFFYKLYSFSLSEGQNNSMWACIMVIMFVMFNLFTVINIVLLTTTLKFPNLNYFTIIIICSFIAYLLYALLLKNNKSQEILNEFNATKKGKAVLNFYLFFYIILSIGSFIITL